MTQLRAQESFSPVRQEQQNGAGESNGNLLLNVPLGRGRLYEAVVFLP